MTDQELAERIAAVKREHARGYYLDALELERDLLRDLVAEAGAIYHEAQGGEVLAHLRREVAYTRAR